MFHGCASACCCGMKSEKNCCDHKTFHFQIDNDYISQGANKIIQPIFVFLAIPPVSTLEKAQVYPVFACNQRNHPPPELPGISLPVLYCSFLI